MKKYAYLLMVGAIVVSLLAACAPTPTPTEAPPGEATEEATAPPEAGAVTIRVINQERWAPYVEKAVEKWNEEHPDQPVELDQLVLGYPQLRQKISTAAAGGKAPDFSLIDSVWVAEFAKAGYLKPLDEIDSDWVESDYNQDFYPVFVAADSYDGHPYAIHSQTDMAVIWYRKDWFEAEGIEAPTTWDELLSAAQHFQQDEIRQKYGLGEYAFAFPAGMKAAETVTYQLTPFIWSNGGTTFAEDQVALNSANTRAAVKFLADLVNTYQVASPETIAYEWNSALKLFGTGKVAISLGGSYESSMIKEASGWDDATFREKAGFVPIPAGPNGEQSTTAGGMAYAVYQQSEHPELALEILKLATGPELMKEFCVSTGQNPPRISVVESLDPEENWFLVETSDMLYKARGRPSIAEYAKVSEQLQMMVENAVSGRMSAEDAVAKAAESISTITGLPLLEAGVPTVIRVINQERWAPYVEKAVEKWNELHPDRPVELDQLVLGYPQLRQKISTAAAGGKAPDFSLNDSVWVAEFAQAGFLKPLDEIDPNWVESDYSQDFFPVFVEGDSYQGHPYGIHSQTDMALIWYRKDWFEAEGIAPPTTWDELVEAATHFQDDAVRAKYGIGEYAFAFPAGMKAAETVTYQLTPFIWSNGGDVFSDGKVVLNSDNAVAAIKLLADLVNTYQVVSPESIAYEWNTALKLLGTGKVAMSVGGSYEGSMIKEAAGWDDAAFREKVGFVPIPAGPNGDQSTTAGGMVYTIYQQSEHPELALEILKLTTGPELMYEFCATTGQNPPRISVVEQLDAEKDWLLVETSDMLYKARVRPIIPEYAKVSEQLQMMVENAVSGRMSAEDAVAKAAEAISMITGLPQE